MLCFLIPRDREIQLLITLLGMLNMSMVIWEMQENYYLVLFMFASQLYFYVLGPISLLGY